MDTFSARRLICLAFFLLLFPVCAFSTTRSEAKAACEATAASADFPARHADCNTESSDSSGHRRFELQGDSKWDSVARVWLPPKMVFSYYWWEVDDTPEQCKATPDTDAYVDAASVAEAESYKNCREGGPGGKACVVQFVNGSNLGIRPPGYKHYLFSGSWHATGGTCTVGEDGDWSADDGVAPSNPRPAPASTPAEPPRACGGGSCVTPDGRACIVTEGGTQYCTPTGSADPSSNSACYSDGSSTVCAGNKPPLPNPPPITPVGDPATDIVSSDHYGTMSPNGSTSTTTVNNYTGGSTSGAKPGDVQGGTGTAGGDTGGGGTGTGSGNGDDPGAGSFSGGTDCTTPPVCTGDAVLCGTARSNWALLCKLHKDVGSDDPKPDISAPAPGEPNKGDLWGSPGGAGTGNGVVDSAMAGNFDMSGFGIGTECPMEDLEISFNGQSASLPLSQGCVVGPWLRGIVIAFALFYAAMIMGKGN